MYRSHSLLEMSISFGIFKPLYLHTDKVGEILAMEKKLADAMKIMLGINPKVHLVAPKSIVRSEGKAVRVIDKRKLHD